MINNRCNTYEGHNSLTIQHRPLGKQEVDRRIRNCSWITDYIYHQWAPTGDSDDAYGAVARILAVSIAIGSHHPKDISHALGLPLWFVKLVLRALEDSDWHQRVYPSLLSVTPTPPSLSTIKYSIDAFMLDFQPRIDWSDVLEAVEKPLRGVGRPPFDAQRICSASELKAWYHNLGPRDSLVIKLA